MKSLPDRPDLDQLRTQAKELKRALAEGEEDAKRRVFESHPKFTGRAPERMEGFQFGLRDAQVTLAREHGFESWKELLKELQGEEVVRWKDYGEADIIRRAFREAQKNGQRCCSDEHFVLALLDPPEATVAKEVLEDLGVTYDEIADTMARHTRRRRSKDSGITSTPAFQLLIGMAQGISIGMGSSQVTDEHVLIALTFKAREPGSPSYGANVDADEILTSMSSHGYWIPTVAPPVARTPHGPWGPLVYYPQKDHQLVTQEVLKHYPPGTGVWLTNRSKRREGFWYAFGEDEIPVERLVRRSVKDKAAVEVLPFEEGQRRETSGARPTRRRPAL